MRVAGAIEGKRMVGFYAETGRYEDLVESGVIDPQRCAGLRSRTHHRLLR